MAFTGRMFGVWLAVLLAAGQGWAAGLTREQRAFDIAVSAFHDGLWSTAELQFAEFIQKYPDSPDVARAGLLAAQAQIKQEKFTEAEGLLTALRPKAGALADDCTYWLGEAQYQQGDLQTAAATLASLPKSSRLALLGAVEAGAAMARIGQWSQLIAFFQMDQDLFQVAEQTDADDELVLRGKLLLAQAHAAEKDYAEAGRLLAAIRPAVLPPDLDWQRAYLLCQVKVTAKDLAEALPLATQLVDLARRLSGANAITNLPVSVALRATVLEGLGREAEAMAAYRENLSTNAPPEQQRQAILKIASLAIAQGQYTNAEAVLLNYVTQFTNAPALDAALLTLGELNLHASLAQPGSSNLLASATSWLNQLLSLYPNSSFAGKAYLDRGWCVWLAGDKGGSQADFKKATLALPPSEDLAVARFKLADTLFFQGDYADALDNYQAVLLHFTPEFPRVLRSLGNQALYQSLRAQLALGKLTEASNTLSQIVAAYPLSELSQSGAPLLLGEDYSDLNQPTNALAVFHDFLTRVPDSPLRPTVELALARAYEQEGNWPAAIAQYGKWLGDYPANAQVPQALYSEAWANFQAGDETNALLLFTNFVARYPLHGLAPIAQWWVADHYFRLGESVDAERNYNAIFQNTNWQNSAPMYPAIMMAGRAAVSRTDNPEAIRDYFEKLENDTNCPPDLRVQATFAHASALMKMDSADTNNPTANFFEAVKVLTSICTYYPTNEMGARAWGMIGDCYMQLSRYDDATNAYWQAINFAGTNVALHSEAQVGLGTVLRKKADLLPAGADQRALFNQAQSCFWSVLNGASFNENEPEQDLFWTREAGLKAAELAVALSHWQEATNYYGHLLRLMPELQPLLAAKIDAANAHLNVPEK